MKSVQIMCQMALSYHAYTVQIHLNRNLNIGIQAINSVF